MDTARVSLNRQNIVYLRSNPVVDHHQERILLNWYELEGSSLIGEENITRINIKDILKIFEAPFWNGLYHCWALDEDKIAHIQPYVDHVIDPLRHAYFIEIYTVSEVG